MIGKDGYLTAWLCVNGVAARRGESEERECLTSKLSALEQNMKLAFSANMELPSVGESVSVGLCNGVLAEMVWGKKGSAHSPIRIRAPCGNCSSACGKQTQCAFKK